MPDPQIVYRVNAYPLPSWAEDMVTYWMGQANVPVLEISSSWRTVEDQARIMVDLIKSHGAPYVEALYKTSSNPSRSHGSMITDAYNMAPNGMEIAAVAQVIEQIGPVHVSNHMNPDRVTFDIAPKSMPDDVAARLLTVLKGAAAYGDIAELIYPPKDPAFHVAIDVNGRGGWPPGEDEDDAGGGGVLKAVGVTVAILLGLRWWLNRG